MMLTLTCSGHLENWYLTASEVSEMCKNAVVYMVPSDGILIHTVSISGM